MIFFVDDFPLLYSFVDSAHRFKARGHAIARVERFLFDARFILFDRAGEIDERVVRSACEHEAHSAFDERAFTVFRTALRFFKGFDGVGIIFIFF